MKVVIGLGNPGTRYAETRHNVGWMVLDRLADRAGLTGRQRSRDGAASVRGRHGDLDLLLVKPLTFMNDSGIAVRKVMARERVPMSDVLVVVDDFALPLGRLRIREDGSAGGHNGLRSIIAEMGTQRFARLRVGIGEPSRDAIDHVLSRFAPSERKLLDTALDAAVAAVEDWAREGPARAANRWNAWRPETGDDGRRSATEAAPATGTDAPPAVDPGHPGASSADGIVRTRTGWRRILSPRPDGSRRVDGR